MSKPLTSSELKALEVISARYGSGMNCLPSGFVATLTDLSLLQSRRAIKSLQRRGYVELIRGIFNDEGQICGSGYCCTRSGYEAQAVLASVGSPVQPDNSTPRKA